MFLLGMPLLKHTSAQDGPMEEGLFWLLLETTNETLLNSFTAPPDAEALSNLNDIWEGVTEVQLADGSILPVDTSWLLIESDTTQDELVLLQARVQALLNYQKLRGGLPPNSEEMLAELERLLQQGRFQYDEEQQQAPPSPPPANVNAPNTGGLGNALGLLFQMMLVVVGIVLVIMLLIWLARNLRVQRASLEADLDGEDIPVSSDAATELAAQSKASEDYRAAIRYLYLSSLLLLDERGLIHFDPSLTNFEHLGLVEHQPQLVEVLRPIVNIFDRVWYGFSPVNEAHYQKFVQLVDRLRQLQA
jgi:hypothetical protein